MCGIIYYLNSNYNDINTEEFKNCIVKLEARGPDNSQFL